MDNVFKKFYRSCYNRTNGFIPTKPLYQNMYPGDFFQIKNGEVVGLGNIFRNGVIRLEDCKFINGIRLNPANWNFSEGVAKHYSGRGSGHNPVGDEFGFSRQVLAFDDFGSFIFHSYRPEAVKIANWNAIQDQLTIKLTQTMYSFRELYVVIESAVAEDWTLAIGSSKKAELEIATKHKNFGLVDLFGKSDSKTIQAREIEFYHKETRKKPSFFRAKKLAVQQDKQEDFISNFITERTQYSSWVSSFYEYDFHHDTLDFSTALSQNVQTNVLDMLQANALNPNTALEYFNWVDANLDDIEKYFLVYGN